MPKAQVSESYGPFERGSLTRRPHSTEGTAQRSEQRRSVPWPGTSMGRRRKAPRQIPLVYVTVPPDRLEAEVRSARVAHFAAFPALCAILRDRGVRRLRCLGIGDPCRSAAARLQTAFAMQVAAECGIAEISFFDPATCESCGAVLQRLGFAVERENANGAVQFEEGTALFMPHCPRFLYHNALAANWSPEQLQRMLIVGNSFAAYEERVRLFIQKRATAVEGLYAAGAVGETALDFGGNEFFDNTAVMTVRAEALPPKEDAFWERPKILEESDL